MNQIVVYVWWLNHMLQLLLTMAKEMDIDAPEPIKWIKPRMNNMKVHWLERNNHMLYSLHQSN